MDELYSKPKIKLGGQEEMEEPRRIPEGLTGSSLAHIFKLEVDEDWRVNEKYRCKTCKSPALCNPFTNQYWGCLGCDLTTSTIHEHFEPVPEVEVAA